ncbi:MULTISPECIES: alpha/beta fold hydrolase [Kitasatospora]|uniref:Putative hydrolase n=1 Tax=Kitasatospora setae (strain ATCC 33774 / DSM 43861 / JCM 3304 / KCC A-0304 / NBRC 14216 / KM-6054) TaxID=452652 RepID=E4N520_KITSK|nr:MULTISPECIES: alpha/beta fold hydrolase [Kitasatospora]BAJ26301.1 putative hydrolase [Kitasatospora setae KM-6054]
MTIDTGTTTGTTTTASATSRAATYVLVHGAWHSGRVWERVAPLLARAGHRVLAPSLTGHGERAHLLGPEVGLDTHTADVVGLLLDEDLTDVVLVGHSYAGMVVSAVADRVPERLAALVYLDAMVPVDGESVLDVMPATRHLLELAATTGTPWRIPPLPEQPAPVGLFGVTDPADAAWLRTLLSDESARCFRQPVGLANPAAAAVPRTHIHCVGALPPGAVRRPVPARQPNGAPSRVRELRSGHDCMVTAPEQLAELLLEEAEFASEPAR